MPRIGDLKGGWEAANKPPQQRPATAPAHSMAGVTGYAQEALARETLAVAMAPEGTRNDALNKAGFNLAQLVAGGELPPELMVQELTLAARSAGLDDVEISRTLRSALPAGGKLPRTAPAAPDLGWIDTLPTHTPTPNIPTPQNDTQAHTVFPSAPEQLFNRDVALELHKEHVKEAARRVLKAEHDANRAKPRMIGLAEFLAEPDEDVQYRVDELWPTGGRIIFAAQYKSGKSTAVGNVLRSLADGMPLFDKFGTAPAHKIVLIDNELDERTMRRWLRDQGIRHPEAVQLVPLRGKVSAFDILDEHTCQQWSAALNGADVVILDCLRPVLDSLGLSEDKDAGRFLVAFDTMLDRAGVSEALIVHHMGHNGERSRGDSRILDWPTATWRIIRENSDDTDSPRYFSAFGRDVQINESRIEYDPTNRHLVLIDGLSRRASKTEAALEQVVAFLKTQDAPLSGNRVEKAPDMKGYSCTVIRNALKEGAEKGVLVKGYTGWAVVRLED